MKVSEIFDFIANSSSVQMYVKQAVCYIKTTWWNVNEWKPGQRETKEAKEKPDSFVLTERIWTNCHAVKIKIKRTTSCSNLPIKVRETAKRAASWPFTVNSEKSMAPLK